MGMQNNGEKIIKTWINAQIYERNSHNEKIGPPKYNKNT